MEIKLIQVAVSNKVNKQSHFELEKIIVFIEY